MDLCNEPSMSRGSSASSSIWCWRLQPQRWVRQGRGRRRVSEAEESQDGDERTESAVRIMQWPEVEWREAAPDGCRPDDAIAGWRGW